MSVEHITFSMVPETVSIVADRFAILGGIAMLLIALVAHNFAKKSHNEQKQHNERSLLLQKEHHGDSLRQSEKNHKESLHMNVLLKKLELLELKEERATMKIRNSEGLNKVFFQDIIDSCQEEHKKTRKEIYDLTGTGSVGDL